MIVLSKRWLFLDDTQLRHVGFDVHCLNHSNVVVTHVYTAAQAIETINKEEPFDCIWLDHDLESTDRDCTGLTVAEYIALHAANKPKQVVVHSHNPTGAKQMVEVLVSAGIPAKAVEYKAPIEKWNKYS